LRKGVKAPPPADDGGKVIDLMEALRRSVHGQRRHKGSAGDDGKRKVARRSKKVA
jgi:hypothetical protein